MPAALHRERCRAAGIFSDRDRLLDFRIGLALGRRSGTASCREDWSAMEDRTLPARPGASCHPRLHSRHLKSIHIVRITTIRIRNKIPSLLIPGSQTSDLRIPSHRMPNHQTHSVSRADLTGAVATDFILHTSSPPYHRWLKTIGSPGYSCKMPLSLVEGLQPSAIVRTITASLILLYLTVEADLVLLNALHIWHSLSWNLET